MRQLVTGIGRGGPCGVHTRSLGGRPGSDYLVSALCAVCGPALDPDGNERVSAVGFLVELPLDLRPRATIAPGARALRGHRAGSMAVRPFDRRSTGRAAARLGDARPSAF